MLSRIDSPKITRFRSAYCDNNVWENFSVMETIGDPALSPGNFGMPACEGRNGVGRAVCICDGGMVPELARGAAYKGAKAYIRISGYILSALAMA